MRHIVQSSLRLWNYCSAYRYSPDLVGATAYSNYLRMWHQLARAAENKTETGIRTKVRVPRYGDSKVYRYMSGVVVLQDAVIVHDELVSTHTIASHSR